MVLRADSSLCSGVIPGRAQDHKVCLGDQFLPFWVEIFLSSVSALVTEIASQLCSELSRVEANVLSVGVNEGRWALAETGDSPHHCMLHPWSVVRGSPHTAQVSCMVRGVRSNLGSLHHSQVSCVDGDKGQLHSGSCVSRTTLGGKRFPAAGRVTAGLCALKAFAVSLTWAASACWVPSLCFPFLEQLLMPRGASAL